MLAGDIRGKQRRADGEPADLIAAQEVVARGTIAPGVILGDRKDDDKIDDNYGVHGSR